MEIYEENVEETKIQAQKLEEAKKFKTALILTVVASSILVFIGFLNLFVPLYFGSRGFLFDFSFYMEKNEYSIGLLSFALMFLSAPCVAPSFEDLRMAILLLVNKKIDGLEVYQVAGQPNKGSATMSLFYFAIAFLSLSNGGALQVGLGLSGWYWFFVALAVAAWIVGLVANFMMSNLLKERQLREKMKS